MNYKILYISTWIILLLTLVVFSFIYFFQDNQKEQILTDVNIQKDIDLNLDLPFLNSNYEFSIKNLWIYSESNSEKQRIKLDNFYYKINNFWDKYENDLISDVDIINNEKNMFLKIWKNWFNKDFLNFLNFFNLDILENIDNNSYLLIQEINNMDFQYFEIDDNKNKYSYNIDWLFDFEIYFDNWKIKEFNFDIPIIKSFFKENKIYFEWEFDKKWFFKKIDSKLHFNEDLMIDMKFENNKLNAILNIDLAEINFDLDFINWKINWTWNIIQNDEEVWKVELKWEYEWLDYFNILGDLISYDDTDEQINIKINYENNFLDIEAISDRDILNLKWDLNIGNNFNIDISSKLFRNNELLEEYFKFKAKKENSNFLSNFYIKEEKIYDLSLDIKDKWDWNVEFKVPDEYIESDEIKLPKIKISWNSKLKLFFNLLLLNFEFLTKIYNRDYYIPDYDKSNLELVDYIEDLPKEENAIYELVEFWNYIEENSKSYSDIQDMFDYEKWVVPWDLFRSRSDFYWDYDFDIDYENWDKLYFDENIWELLLNWLEKYNEVFEYYYNNEEFKQNIIKLNNIINKYEYFQLDKSYTYDDYNDLMPILSSRSFTRNILWVAIYACSIWDYWTCLRYIDLNQNIWNFLYNWHSPSPVILTWSTISEDTIRGMYLIVKSFELPDSVLNNFKKIIKKYYTKNNISLKNFIRYKFILFKNSLDKIYDDISLSSEEEKFLLSKDFNEEETLSVYWYYLSKHIDWYHDEAVAFLEEYKKDKFRKNYIWRYMIDNFSTTLILPNYPTIDEELKDFKNKLIGIIDNKLKK